MVTYYVLSSEVRGVHVPIGKVHLLRRDAETAARNINHALPGVRAQVLELNGDALDSEPELIREHVRQFLQAQG
jgi:hypothetical protein